MLPPLHLSYQHIGEVPSMENAFHGMSVVFHILDKCCFCLLHLLYKTNQAYDFDKANSLAEVSFEHLTKINFKYAL